MGRWVLLFLCAFYANVEILRYGGIVTEEDFIYLKPDKAKTIASDIVTFVVCC